MTLKQTLNSLQAPDGSYYVTLTDGVGNLVSAGGGGGSGTVTSVSVITANGVSGTVATATTTPAISLTLGAITPTSVAIGAGSAITSSGAGGSLGTNAFTSTAYAPIASPTFTGTVTLPDASTFGTNFSIAGNAKLTAPSAAVLQHGAADAAAPVAQTIQAQSVVAGTSNTAGVDWTFNGSRGTGTGAGGRFIFQGSLAGTTGSTQNALVNSMIVDPVGNITLFNSGGTNTLTAGSGVLIANASGSLRVVTSNNTMLLGAGDWRVASGTALKWTTSDYTGANQNILGPDGANVLGLKNGTTAQTFNIYATTDVSVGAPTNYERISITKTIGGAATIDVQNGGTGAAATQFAIKLAGTAKIDWGVTQTSELSLQGPVYFYNGVTPFAGFNGSANFVVASNANFGSTLSGVRTTQDTSFSRASAGVWQVGTGTSNNALGGFAPQTKAGAFVASDFPSGAWYVGRDTSGATTKLYYNNAGTLMSVALT